MLTQEDYKLWTGEDASAYTQSEWNRIVRVAAARLASFLCLEKIPGCPDAIDDQLRMLLANFICAVLHFKGNPSATVSSKSVRNFTISFSSASAANAFSQVAENYIDIVERYSKCGDGMDVERSHGYRCL